MQGVDPHEVNRKQHQDDDRHKEQPKRHRNGHGNQELCLETLVEHQRCESSDRGHRSEQNGAETAHARFPNGLSHLLSLLEVAVERRHKHQGVVDEDADEGNHAQDAEQADLGAQDPVPEADANESKGNQPEDRHTLQRRAERQDDDEQHERKNEWHDRRNAVLRLGLLAVLAFVTGPNRGILGEDAWHHVGLNVGIGIRCADARAGQIRTHLHLPLSVQAIDGGDAAFLAHFCKLLQGHEAPVRSANAVPLQVAHGAAIGVVKTHPNTNFITSTLQSLDLTPKETLPYLRQQGGPGHAKLEGAWFGLDFQLAQPPLVVVGDVFQVLALKHGLLQFVRRCRQRPQIRAQQRH